MEQLTKPTLLNGEPVVNVQLTNQNTKNLHEALLYYLRSHTAHTNESSYIEIKLLREEVLKLRRLMNPS